MLYIYTYMLIYDKTMLNEISKSTNDRQIVHELTTSWNSMTITQEKNAQREWVQKKEWLCKTTRPCTDPEGKLKVSKKEDSSPCTPTRHGPPKPSCMKPIPVNDDNSNSKTYAEIVRNPPSERSAATGEVLPSHSGPESVQSVPKVNTLKKNTN